YSPKEPQLLLDAWERVEATPSVTSRPTDAEVIEFLVSGDASAPLMTEALAPNRGEFIVSRPPVDRAIDFALQPGTVLAVIGDLGAGKGFVTECVSQAAISKGWEVHQLVSASPDEISEAEQLMARGGPQLLIIESYGRHLELLRWLADIEL